MMLFMFMFSKVQYVHLGCVWLPYISCYCVAVNVLILLCTVYCGYYIYMHTATQLCMFSLLLHLHSTLGSRPVENLRPMSMGIRPKLLQKIPPLWSTHHA